MAASIFMQPCRGVQLLVFTDNILKMQNIRSRIHFILIAAVALAFYACAFHLSNTKQKSPSFSISTQAWQEADRLFKSDPHWLGGDGAYSVDLGNERVLWLFGDSFINPGNSARRTDATVIRNSLAIQKGYNPSLASIKFYWQIKNNRPSSFFSEEENSWFWPGTGIRMGNYLLIFLVKVINSSNSLNFDINGWAAVLIDNPDAEPDQWIVKWLEVPENPFNIIVGSASAIKMGNYVYAFSASAKDHRVYLARCPLPPLFQGNLSTLQWWAGEKHGWVPRLTDQVKPAPLFSEGQMEFTVHYEPALKGFLQIQTKSLQDPAMAMRWAGEIDGPWSSMKDFYRPPESGKPGMLIYAGKAHPCLKGADIIFTYAVNTTSFDQLLQNLEIYYPVFLKGTFDMTNMPPAEK